MKVGRIVGDIVARIPLLNPQVKNLQLFLRSRRTRRKHAQLEVKPFDVESYLPSDKVSWVAPIDVSVAVVIPVYRGLEETKRCLESVIENRDEIPVEIIVVDDCSPDPAISEWLRSLSAQGLITLLYNEKNRGFVASVNRGMNAADSRDVVLLNSDTQVPKNWLRRLVGHAYSGPRIGSVTPFSNNATICSWPTIEGSDLPAGKTLSQLDEAFFAANRGRQVTIPTAVGFCMYIRRDCLRAVGNFDEVAFGRGYGEENDFCMRAFSAGWSHILACDTFVYHVGETSFGKASPERAKSWGVLIKRYPNYPLAVSRHIEADEACSSRFAATAMLFKTAVEPTVLIVTHSLGGGTDKHVNDLMTSVGGRVNFLRLESVSGRMRLSVPSLADHPTVDIANDQVSELVQLLRSFGVDRVHIHHWIGMGMDLRELIDELGQPFDVTIHDYFSICPQINLMCTPDSQYCGEPGEESCNACIAARPQFDATTISEWRTRTGWMLQEAERVICPSEDVRIRMARYAPNARFVTVLHEPVTESEWKVQAPRLAAGERMRIGLIGAIGKHKGRNELVAAAKACNPALFEFSVIGYCGPPMPTNLSDRVRETGRYDESELQQLIKDEELHAIWFPNPWPETYCYTLTAAIDAGLPIVASNLGAFPERLEGRPLTWRVAPSCDGRQIAKTFESVRKSLESNSSVAYSRRQVHDHSFYPNSYLELVVRRVHNLLLGFEPASRNDNGDVSSVTDRAA